MLVIYVGIVGIPMCHIFPCNLYVMLSLPSLGLTMGIG
jgi:hypothetical protein